jgi:hypothetical protein
MSIRYDENHQAKAVRLVREHHDSDWAVSTAIARVGDDRGDTAQSGCVRTRSTPRDGYYPRANPVAPQRQTKLLRLGAAPVLKRVW